jgi:branched-chain amino acid transport system permease protein
MAYLIHILILIGIYAILGMSLNLVVGYTGLLSLAQPAFYGIGAYVTALLMTEHGWNFFPALGVAMLVAAAISFLIGRVLSKFRGDYYALVSLGFTVIVYSVFLNWQNITHGPLGIPGIGRPEIGPINFADNVAFLILVIFSAVAVYAISQFIAHSSFGRVLKAIREDEQAISVFGYKTHQFKLAIFVMSAAMTAIAGGLLASYITFIDPSIFTIHEAIFVLAIIILGGLASIRGSILGAIILVILPEAMRFIGFPDEIAAQMRQCVYGLLLVVLMLRRPQGLIGEFKL